MSSSEIWLKDRGPKNREKWDYANKIMIALYMERDGVRGVVPVPAIVDAPALSAVVRSVTAAVSTLPAGSPVCIITDQGNFRGAFDDRAWLAKWQREKFTCSSPKDPEAWRALDALLSERRISLTVRDPKDLPKDRVIVADLALILAGESTRNFFSSAEPDLSDDPWAPDNTEAMHQRAKDRDP
jgi:hypothetical protein